MSDAAAFPPRLMADDGREVLSVQLPDDYTIPGGALIATMQRALASAPTKRQCRPARERKVVRRIV
jgi:hypothetical protein